MELESNEKEKCQKVFESKLQLLKAKKSVMATFGNFIAFNKKRIMYQGRNI